MALFARVENDTVLEVIVIANSDCDNLPFPESEPVGQAFIASMGVPGQWLQTSYTGAFRGLYCGSGFTFDASLGEYGEFVPPPVPTVD